MFESRLSPLLLLPFFSSLDPFPSSARPLPLFLGSSLSSLTLPKLLKFPSVVLLLSPPSPPPLPPSVETSLLSPLPLVASPRSLACLLVLPYGEIMTSLRFSSFSFSFVAAGIWILPRLKLLESSPSLGTPPT
jgi:hypothetical protein